MHIGLSVPHGRNRDKQFGQSLCGPSNSCRMFLAAGGKEGADEKVHGGRGR